MARLGTLFGCALLSTIAACAMDSAEGGDVASEALSSGTGLRGEYFENADLSAPVRVWRDARIDFDWSASAPQGVLSAATFSVRWTGAVEAMTDETYTFVLRADDGARLWLDGALVIDAWSGATGVEKTGRVALRAGQRATIRLEYREQAGASAGVRLWWSTPTRARQIVPQTQLYPPGTESSDAGTDAATGTDATVASDARVDGANPAPDAGSASTVPAAMCGTWVLQQVSGTTELRNLLGGALGRALDTPRVKGFSLRVPWNAVDQDFTVLDEGLRAARARGLAFTPRFMAGRHSPTRIFDAGSPYYVINGSERVPSPFYPDGRPNTVFEGVYREFVGRLAAWARTNGVPLVHLSWYAQDWAELNHGKEVRAVPGYSYEHWLEAHKRLIDIGLEFATPTLAMELPFSGYGPLTDAAGAFADHVLTRLGPSNPRFFFQANGWGPNGDWGAPDATTEANFDRTFTRRVFRGQQAIQPEDYDWRALYQMLVDNHASYAEVYTPSFALARRDLLVQQIAAMADRCAIAPPSP